MTSVTADSVEAQEAARAHVLSVVRRSGTSFLLGMRALPKPRREAMYAIYAFCREVDDIADEPGLIEDKLAGLAAWREEIGLLYAGRPERKTTRALLGPVREYRLEQEEFLQVIDGMEMDAREVMVAPSERELELYCRRVAGAVGMLSIRAFGAREPEARNLAVVLGEALQMTNILRDLDEDAGRGRLYLPRELIEKAGIDPQASVATILADPRITEVCETLAERAEQRFALARQILDRCHRRALKPSILMLEIYHRILSRLRSRGWHDGERRAVRVPKTEKLWIAFRYGILDP